MASPFSAHQRPLAPQGVAPSSRYIEHFKPLTNPLPTGKYWDGKLRTPDLPYIPSPTLSSLQRRCGTQYRGTAEATAIAYAGTVHDTVSGYSPAFRVKIAHPLSQCMQYYRHAAGGKTWILKSKTDQFTMPRSKSTDVAPPAIKPETAGDVISTEFVSPEFRRVNNRIAQLVQRVLPSMPHQLSVPTVNPYRTEFPYENRNTPFEEWEVKALQYMTLVASGSRGVAWVKGDWVDEMNAASPHSVAGLSSVATPRSERDPNRPPPVKMSLADYKAGKRPSSSSQNTRLIPPPGPQVGQNGVSRPSISPTQQMIDQIVLGNTKKMERLREPVAHLDISRPHEIPKAPDSPPFNWDPDPLPSKTLPKPIGQKEKSRAIWPPTKDEPDWKQALSSGPASKPRLENHAAQAPRQTKRPFDTTEPSPPEKRVKLTNPPPSKAQDSTHQRSSSSSKNELPSKSGLQKPRTSHLSPKRSNEINQTVKPTVSTLAKQNDARVGTPNRQLDSHNSMPPLLSPLPAGLISPDHQFETTNAKTAEKNGFGDRGQRVPTKGDAKVEKRHHNQDVKSAEPSDDDLELPPMLSPLPDWWVKQIAHDLAERERLEPPPVSHISNSVGARRERSRQPDAPGVARKTKGHPASSAVANAAVGEVTSSKADRKTNGPVRKADSSVSRKHLIVKLKYGKRNRTPVSRILNLTARPEAGQKMLPSASTAARGSDDRKHARLAEDHEEPSAKRSKLPGNAERQRARTPSVQSPAPAVPTTTQKGTFNTPKKGDALKGVAMRKVDSSDGRILTPRAGAASTPASVEKPRLNGTDAKAMEAEALRVTHAKYLGVGQTLKRQADQILKVKEPNHGPVSDDQKKLGAVVAMEAVVAFMVSYSAFDTLRVLERKQNPGDNWTQFFAFQNFAVDRCRSFKELLTLGLLLGSVCHEALERVYVDRLIYDPAGANPDFIAKLAASSRARVDIWNRYSAANKDSPVGFVITVPEARVMANSILTEFCQQNKIPWEKKVEF